MRRFPHVFSHRHDSRARALVEGWEEWDAALLTSDDLSRPGWCHDLWRPGSGRAVVSGRQVSVADAFLDQRVILETEVELWVDGGTGGQLRVREDVIDLGDVTAVYLRPYESRRMPSVIASGAGSTEAGHALSVEDALVSWLDLTPALVVNRPTAMASNTSKPYQATLIAAQGFAIPATLITTDSKAARAFLAEHGQVIYKSVSGVRSIVSRLRSEDLDRLADVAWCPTQFQQYVPGTDVRVHVVGDEVFACEIVSEADDYRYAGLRGESSELRRCDLPTELAARCRRLSAALELPVAGVDLRRTPEGIWYCFEVNPAPGFSYFQQAAGLPIDETIADLLLAPPRRPHRERGLLPEVLAHPSGCSASSRSRSTRR